MGVHSVSLLPHFPSPCLSVSIHLAQQQACAFECYRLQMLDDKLGAFVLMAFVCDCWKFEGKKMLRKFVSYRLLGGEQGCTFPRMRYLNERMEG